ncbi:MAG: hypothetical protein AB7P49_03200 [Bdellovibrionales bacterium]
MEENLRGWMESPWNKAFVVANLTTFTKVIVTIHTKNPDVVPGLMINRCGNVWVVFIAKEFDSGGLSLDIINSTTDPEKIREKILKMDNHEMKDTSSPSPCEGRKRQRREDESGLVRPR